MIRKDNFAAYSSFNPDKPCIMKPIAIPFELQEPFVRTLHSSFTPFQSYGTRVNSATKSTRA